MFDYEKIEKLTALALESIETKDADAIKEVYKALDDAFLAEFPEKTYAYSGEALYARMKMLASFIEYNIFISNLDGIYDNLYDLMNLAEFAKHQNYSGKMNCDIRWCLKNAEKRFNDWLEEHLNPDPLLYNTDYIDGMPLDNGPQRIKAKAEPPVTCLLCRQRDDFRKGSHLAPNTLIQPFFSVDGTTARGKEIAKEHVTAELKEDRFWGSAVLPEQIEETFGEVVPEEERTAIKPNPLTRDDIFCDCCEKRFGHVENAYGDYLHGRKATINPVVSYLFWISVFWRLSIADMCVRLNDEDEERMRQILDRNLPEDPKVLRGIQPDDSLQGFKYCLYHCEDIKGEVTGLVGNHASHPPYRLIVGNYVVVMYPESYDDGVERQYNSYIAQEKMVEEPFLDFWKHKRSILDEVNLIEDTDLNDESANISDVVKCDNAWEMKVLASDSADRITLDDVKQIGEAGKVNHPGAVLRMLAWTKEHQHLSIPEQCQGIKEELGYTYEESEYIYKWFMTHFGVSELKARK